MNEEILEKIVNSQKWIFAKTYANFAPHEYIVQEKCSLTTEDFLYFCQTIKDFGIYESFTIKEKTRKYKYLHFQGYKYWFIENIINRVPKDK